MTIFCDWPRGLVCNLCTKRVVLPKAAETTVEHDTAMRNAGWVEYAPRFVVGTRHARPLHVCSSCIVKLESRDGLRVSSIESTPEGLSKTLRRSERRLDVELGLARSTKGQKLGSRRS